MSGQEILPKQRKARHEKDPDEGTFSCLTGGKAVNIAHAENNPAMGLYWFLRRRELWQV